MILKEDGTLELSYFCKMNKFQLSSDHYIHVNILNKIRESNFSFRVTKISCYNEKHTAYPIFFHYLLYFL